MAVPNRLSGSLPVSIAAHLAALVLLLVIPLTAQVALPFPPEATAAFIRAVPAPPPPAPLVRAASARGPASSRVPTEAPPAIVPELSTAPPPPPTDEGVELGPPGVVGVPMQDTGGDAPPPAPPPVTRPSGPVRAGELVQAPRKLADVRPSYPDIARAAHVQGTVVLDAILDRSGRISQVRVIRSVPMLDQAAIEAVRQWRYTPSTLHGVPVEVLMTITVTFTLQE